MRFGNTPAILIQLLKTGLVMGILGAVFGATMLIFYEKKEPAAVLPVLCLVPGIPIILMMAAGPSVLFSIHINNGWVEHRFMNRRVLSRARLSDYEGMDAPAQFCAAVLRFSGGQNIRFYAAHAGEIRALKLELSKQSQEARRV